MHNASSYIVNQLVSNNINTLVIGSNKEWKQDTNMGKQNNQNFVSIPFNKIINMITYKAESFSINVNIIEESYTSKSSFLDLDDIPTFKEGEKYKFSGKRISRGLYKTKEGIIINADINGASNIIRKEFPNAFNNLNLEYLYKTTNVVTYKDLYK